jgi:hypothetical protein
MWLIEKEREQKHPTQRITSHLSNFNSKLADGDSHNDEMRGLSSLDAVKPGNAKFRG